MRGAVSLAAALAIPTTVASGAPFPDRDLILWLVFCVIFFTLVVQGLTLPLLIRRLGVTEDPAVDRDAELRGRRAIAEAALTRLDELEAEDWVREDTAARVRALYEYRLRRFTPADGGDDLDEGSESRAGAYKRLIRLLLEAQRQEVIELRRRGAIPEAASRRIANELDLEHERLSEQ